MAVPAPASMATVLTVPTTAYADQKPGTSGLRKKVVHFQQPHYLANFVQALFNALPESEYRDQTLLVSGDGRYWGREACQIIAEIAAANGVARLWIGKHAWVSTPAASCIIREREGGVCRGGLLLTASHNPGGPTEDFGIKYNMANGGPAPESITDAIYAETRKIVEYKRVPLPYIDMQTVGVQQLTDRFVVEIIDPVEDWVALMKRIFDFGMLKNLVSHPDFSFVYDGMNGIAGPYAKAIFVEELGCEPSSCLEQCEPLEDFGKGHPDPNLTYAHRLVEQMRVLTPSDCDDAPVFGAAGDGDNDRNMILGRGWFVTPSDSVAIIADYAEKCIPYFAGGLKGVARSMPTSEALKLVGEKRNIQSFEVPTGWKFFGNLMDAGLCSICGEESFGTGSDHIREKDGLWAVLAWMSILAYRLKTDKKIVSMKQINEEFWAEYGRNYYVRYDYENVDSGAATRLMSYVAALDYVSGNESSDINVKESYCKQTNKVVKIDTFEYKDPVDQSVSANQGVRVFFADDSRFVLRLSGTGSSGATVRLYMEKYSQKEVSAPATEAMKDFIASTLRICAMREILGTDEPTVRT